MPLASRKSRPPPSRLGGAAGSTGCSASRRPRSLVIGIGVAVSQGGGDEFEPASSDTAAVRKEFAWIPQKGNVLGQPGAPATLIEYNDLQCPACKAYATEVLPGVLSRYVRPGKVKLALRPVAIIGPDSQPAADAAAAASLQDKMLAVQRRPLPQPGHREHWLRGRWVHQGHRVRHAGLDVNRLLSDKDSAQQGACLPVGEAG